MDKKRVSPTDHLANERTFLAWIRTSIAIMAFGFVVVKFALFLRQVVAFMNTGAAATTLPDSRYSVILGIALVGLGTLMALLAFLRYKNTEKQLLNDTYYPSFTLSLLFTIVIVLTGILLVIYLTPGI